MRIIGARGVALGVPAGPAAGCSVARPGPGGSSITLAHQVNLVISGYTGCRLPAEDR